jgi:hypothetical protein
MSIFVRTRTHSKIKWVSGHGETIEVEAEARADCWVSFIEIKNEYFPYRAPEEFEVVDIKEWVA